MRNFYLTTTLPYVNADPHIGFALESVQADAIVRYRRLIGDTVFFTTGTDEHGQKIAQKAKEEGATDIEIHDTVLIAALFCLYNRYVDGLATVTPPTDTDFYNKLGNRLKDHGYNRLPQGYDHLKKQQA